jgi:hypothetical protein
MANIHRTKNKQPRIRIAKAVDLDLNGKKREKSKGERKSADPIGRESKKQELG